MAVAEESKKKCCNCHNFLPFEHFIKNGREQRTCVKCLEQKKEYYARKREEILESKRIYHIEHREERIAYNRQYVGKNREILYAKQREYWRVNKETRMAQNKIWREKNIERVREYRKGYCLKNKEILYQKAYERLVKNRAHYNERARRTQKNRLAQNPHLRVRRNLSRLVNFCIRNDCGKSLTNILGYEIGQLVNHLINISGKDVYDKYVAGNSGYHLDHIIPHSLYRYQSLEDKEFIKCWSYRNLRLIPGRLNIQKSNQIDMSLVEKYCIADLLPEIA